MMSEDNKLSTAISLTRELIHIDSSDPGAYEQEIGDFLFQWFSNQRIQVQKDQVLPGRYNVLAKIQGEIDDPALIYICHMDTVTLGDGWTKDPLGAEESNGRIYGRGACDMKSGLACAVLVY